MALVDDSGSRNTSERQTTSNRLTIGIHDVTDGLNHFAQREVVEFAKRSRGQVEIHERRVEQRLALHDAILRHAELPCFQHDAIGKC